MITIRQHVPPMIETDDRPQRWTVEIAADLDKIPWIAAWKDTPPHTFDHYAIGGDGRLLMAIYDNGNYWWVLGYLSEPIPGLPAWNPPSPVR